MKLFILLMIICFSANSKKIELKDLYKLGHENNGNLKASRFQVLSSLEDEGTFLSQFYPRLGVELGKSVEKTNNQKQTEDTRFIYGEINLFNGGKDYFNLLNSKLISKVRRNQNSANRLELEFDLEQKFYHYFFLKKKKELVQDTLKRNKKLIKLVNRRLSSGIVTKADLLEFNLKESKIISKINYISQEMLEVKASIVSLVNDEDIDLVGELPHLELVSSQDDLIDYFGKESDFIKRLNLELMLVEGIVKEARSGWMPTVDLAIKHGRLDEETSFSNNENSTNLSLNIKWELFSGFHSKHKSSSAYYKKLSKEHKLKQMKISTHHLLKAKLNKLVALESQVIMQEKQSKIASDLYKATVRQYQKGIKDSGALSSVSDELLEINSSIYESKAEYIEHKIQIESILGKRIEFKKTKH